ncbi:MAG: hypothetical protein HYW24_01595 [Candidatus Aenigmarchaeota archaeon]|nr:hypothetical protein [Candidatus Aenigmarchaeota archaeon]
MMKQYLSRLKGKNKLETVENYSMMFIFIGAVVLSTGIGLSIINTKGLSAILAMLGALTTFVSTATLIVVWVIKEFNEK